MFDVTENNEQLKIKIFSKREKIKEVTKRCIDFVEKQGVSDFISLEKILKELLENAITHGNKNQENKKILVNLKLTKNGKYKIEVQNQGSGFNYKLLEFDTEAQSGLSLVKSLSEKLSFSPKGTKVNVTITLNKFEIEEEVESENIREKKIEEEIMQEKSEFENFEENGVEVIIPQGDIISAKANQLRLLLLELLKNEKKSFKFDFSNVEDIDSSSFSLFIILPKMLKVEAEENRPQIINTTEKITNLFNYTNLSKFYNISGKRG